MNRPMRIAIVCGTYVQGKSYQENVWAEQLAKAGHAVRVFFKGELDEPVVVIDEPLGQYETQRVATRVLPRSTFWSKSLPGHMKAFAPDLMVVMGDKTMAVPLARSRELRNVPMISTFSENLAMHEFNWRKRGISLKQRLWALGFLATRGWAIRSVCRRSSLVVGNTPQAREILSRLFNREEWRSVDRKVIDKPLGFSPEHFRYDPHVRARVRRELGFAETDVVICASSHFIPIKEPSMRLIITAVGSLFADHPALKGLIVGFSEQPNCVDVSHRLSQLIEDHGGESAKRFIKQPFAQRDRLVELYNAADIAVFNRASISCQEALGTGLIGCFADDGSLNHLITMPGQGVFFKPGDAGNMVERLVFPVQQLSRMDVSQRAELRSKLASGSRWLGYDRIIEEILGELGKAPDAA